MTRLIVYGGTLSAFVVATALTIASNLSPHWLMYATSALPPPGEGSGYYPFWQTLGLHQSCSSEARPTCRPFPHSERDCAAGPAQQYFCTIWRSVGFCMSLALVVELATLVGFIVIMSGGRMKREAGWRVLGVLMAIVGVTQLWALSLVSYLLEHDDRFLVPGWRLDSSFMLCSVSTVIAVASTLGLALSAAVLPPEEGYEFLEDPIGFGY